MFYKKLLTDRGLWDKNSLEHRPKHASNNAVITETVFKGSEEAHMRLFTGRGSSSLSNTTQHHPHTGFPSYVPAFYQNSFGCEKRHLPGNNARNSGKAVL